MRLLRNHKTEKGVAGLEVLLGIIILLFVIGFIVMIFSMLGGEMEETIWDSNTTTFANISTATTFNETGTFLTIMTEDARARECSMTVTAVYNTTGAADIVYLDAGNYSVSGCLLQFASTGTTDESFFNNTAKNVSGSFTWLQNTTASYVIFDTSDELSGVTDWYGIIIVIGAMVVLILLTVIIISAIRGTGLVGGMGSGRPPRTTA